MSLIASVPDAVPGTAPPGPPLDALYRAALGPLQVEHHLRAFDRFDASGIDGPRWNPLAAWLTLPWLIHRRLWRIALAYLLVVGVAAAALVGAGLQGQWPEGVLAGLLAALLIAAVAVPGLYANRWLHGQVRQAILGAVAAAPSVQAAVDTLQQRAPSRARWGWVLTAHGLLLGAVLIAAGLAPQWAPWVPGLAVAGDAPAVAAATVDPAPKAVPDAAPREAPSESPPQAPGDEPIAVAAPRDSVADAPPAAPADTVVEVAATPTLEPIAPPAAGQAKAPVRAPAKQRPAAQASAAAANAAGFGINVGLFADPTNADRALERLREAGLPAQRQALETAHGPRVRVRAGPWTTRAQADQAAQRIRALGLEAQVFKAG